MFGPSRALRSEKALEAGEQVVTATLAETVLSPRIDDLEPRLTRYGYDVKSIAEEFHIKPADVRLFLQGQLDPARSRELTEQMRQHGAAVGRACGVVLSASLMLG